MGDKDILKTVVGLKAASDLHAIRAKLEKQEQERKEAELKEFHRELVKAIEPHYTFIVNELHKRFIQQKKSGKSHFRALCLLHHFFAGLASFWGVAIFAHALKDDVGETFFPWALSFCALLYLAYATVAIRRRCMGVYLMFQDLWTGDPAHDLENQEVRSTARLLLEQQAKGAYVVASSLYDIAQRDPEFKLMQMARNLKISA